MDVSTLVLTLAGLLGLFLLLVLLYVFGRKPTGEVPKAAVRSSEPDAPVIRPKAGVRSFDALEAIVLDRSSSKTELHDAVDEIARHYGKLYATTFNRYAHIIMALCRHPQTDKDIIIILDKALRKQNPSMRHELDMALQKGLNSRG